MKGHIQSIVCSLIPEFMNIFHGSFVIKPDEQHLSCRSRCEVHPIFVSVGTLLHSVCVTLLHSPNITTQCGRFSHAPASCSLWASMTLVRYTERYEPLVLVTDVWYSVNNGGAAITNPRNKGMLPVIYYPHVLLQYSTLKAQTAGRPSHAGQGIPSTTTEVHYYYTATTPRLLTKESVVVVHVHTPMLVPSMDVLRTRLVHTKSIPTLVT
jgi:hypothetical protein